MVMRGQESNGKKKKKKVSGRHSTFISLTWIFLGVHKVSGCEEACLSQETELKAWHFFAGTEQRGLMEAMGGGNTPPRTAWCWEGDICSTSFLGSRDS